MVKKIMKGGKLVTVTPENDPSVLGKLVQRAANEANLKKAKAARKKPGKKN